MCAYLIGIAVDCGEVRGCAEGRFRGEIAAVRLNLGGVMWEGAACRRENPSALSPNFRTPGDAGGVLCCGQWSHSE